MRGNGVGVVFHWDDFRLQSLDGFRSERVSSHADEDDPFPGFGHAVVAGVEHFGRQYDVAVAVRAGEVFLYDVFHVAQVDQSLYVFGHEYLWPRDVYHLFHPVIELAAGLLRGLVGRAELSFVILQGVKSLSLPRHAEVLAGKASRYHVDVSREDVCPRLLSFHQLHDALAVVYLRGMAKAAHIGIPGHARLGQDVVGEDRAETGGAQQQPIVVDDPLDALVIGGKRLAVGDEMALKAQVHAAATREEGKHAQFPLGSILFLTEYMG